MIEAIIFTRSWQEGWINCQRDRIDLDALSRSLNISSAAMSVTVHILDTSLFVYTS
jgi:hypothetical protein